MNIMKMSVLQYFGIFCIAMLMLVYGCDKENDPINATTDQSNNKYKYPKSKLWAHRANDTITAQNKKIYFDGLEVDVQYSSTDNELYVGHDEEDTINRLTLLQWFKSLENVDKTCYWIDMKNLNPNNAEIISNKIIDITDNLKIRDKVMVEHTDWTALKIVKDKGLFVILWVYNLNWNYDNIDTATWKNNIKQQIEFLKPDALSCEYRMFPLLPESFPEQNIHFWHTPAELNDANAELTRRLCRNESVKVVLVDYDEPIDY